jgi:beta propeller repeat protein
MKKMLLIVTAILFLVLVSSTASAYTVTRITTNTANQASPSIWSNYIVWVDGRNGGSDVYLQNMATKVQTRVTSGFYVESPFVSGNRIVWTDWRNGNPDIYMYEISTKKTTRITLNTATQVKPCTYGNYIVWQDYRDNNGYSNVYLQNLVTKVQTRISTNGEEPAIYGNKVVYLCYDDTTGTNNINMYDIVSKKTITILKDSNVYSLSMYGNRIMFNRYDGTTHMYDFVAKKWITVPTGFLNEPKFYSNKIVYTDYKFNNQDIYMATI